MKLIVFSIFLVIHMAIYAQKRKTILTNDKDAVALFFPNAIRQALTGSENFTFSYNKDNPQHIGIVQGISGAGSNLVVIDQKGDVYSYRLAFRKVLDTLNYFVSLSERIGNEVPVLQFSKVNSFKRTKSNSNSKSHIEDSVLKRKEYLKNLSRFYLAQSYKFLKKRRKKGLVLSLYNLAYNRTEIYVKIEIKNRTGIDFEVDYLKIFKVNGNSRRKSSYQKLLLETLHKENFPKMVKDSQSFSFVLVLPKFTLGDSERLMLELKEFRGSRILRLNYR